MEIFHALEALNRKPSAPHSKMTKSDNGEGHTDLEQLVDETAIRRVGPIVEIEFSEALGNPGFPRDNGAMNASRD